MDVEERAEGLGAEEPGRRSMPRCAVDEEALLVLVHAGFRVPGRIDELSLEGCRLRSLSPLPAGILTRVEASFRVRGISFRFSGMAEWSDGRNLVGIRFVGMPGRRRDELVEVLCELEAENAAKAEKLAAEKAVAEEQAAGRPAAGNHAPEERVENRVAEELAERQAFAPAAEGPRPVAESPGVGGQREAEPPQAAMEPAVRAVVTGAKPTKRERRVQSRHEVDTSASVLLINVGSWLQGRIQDLSLSGCRIRTDERFPVGIYTRVETEFLLEGLAFRLGGVIQAIHDRNHVGIRFLDVSERKRAQVEQLIEEIEEMRARQEQVKAASGG